MCYFISAVKSNNKYTHTQGYNINIKTINLSGKCYIYTLTVRVFSTNVLTLRMKILKKFIKIKVVK